MVLRVGICHAAKWMQIRMENVEALRPERSEDFLGGSAGIDFTGQTQHGTICVDSEGIGGAAVLLPAQEAARRGARVGEQGRRIKHAASDAADSSVSARRGTPSQPRGAAALSGQVHRGGCRAVGREKYC